MYKKPAFLFAAFAILYIVSSAQPNATPLFKRCPVKIINYEQGLLNNGITDIITDALGFTWISTKTGMQRYNGYTLETINPVVNKELINITSSVCFFALKNNNIWISHKNGVVQYDPNKNSFKKIMSFKSPENLKITFIPLKETNDGIWCLSNDSGLVVCSPQGVILKKILRAGNPFVKNVFSQHDLLKNSVFTVNNNSIFIYDGNKGVEEVNVETYRCSYIDAGEAFSLAATENDLYILSAKKLKSINLENKKIERSISLQKFLRGNITYGSIFSESKGELLLSLNSHLFYTDTAFNYKKEYTNLNGNPLVSVGYISTIYADRFKRIWLLTNDDIRRIQNFDIPFEHFIYDNEKNNFVRSMYYDEKKHLLLAGCYNGGIQLYDTLGNALWQKAVFSENVKDINAIEKLTENNYLVETIGKGL